MEAKQDGSPEQVSLTWQAPPPAPEDDLGVERIRKALSSESFVEKAAIVVLTAVLSSVLGPALISYFNSKATERDKEAEAVRARNTAILQAQAKLLDEVSETVLAYETLALDVSWFRTRRARNEDQHKKAFARYSERAVDLVARWRALASRSRTLASPAISDKLDAFLLRVFDEQDTPINQLYGRDAPESDWESRARQKRQNAQRGKPPHLRSHRRPRAREAPPPPVRVASSEFQPPPASKTCTR
jgi:hypothetical protein